VHFPIGVLIYWSTTNFWTWGQQYYVIKRNPTPGSPAYEELMKKKAEKGLITPEAETNNSQGQQPEQQQGQRQQPKKKKKKK
jgi:YidC/Oxa1 family membrane protein insertase